MRVRETSGWVGKRTRAPRCIYAHFILLRIYGCQYDAWKKALAISTLHSGLGLIIISQWLIVKQRGGLDFSIFLDSPFLPPPLQA